MARKLALVGIGKIARDQHVPAIAGTAAFELAATASRNASLPGVPAYRTLAELLDACPDVSCVSLCTPPQARHADARLALEAGRHVMLEKPPGATLSEVHDLAELAARQGVSLFATWHSRHAAAVEAARQWLAPRRLRELRIEWKEDVRHWHPGQEWIWEPGGLGVFDPGINALSVMTAVLPHPVHLRQSRLEFPANRQTPIAATLDFADPGGARVTAEFDWREIGPPCWNIHIVSDDGTGLLSEGGARLTVDGAEIASGPNREYAVLYDRFAEVLDRGGCEVDLSPLRHVADAFMLGRREITDAFDW